MGLHKLGILVFYKAWRIRKHRKLQTLLEAGAPILLTILLVCVKVIMQPDSDDTDNLKTTVFPVQDKETLISNLCNTGCTTDESTAVLAYTPDTMSARKLMEGVQKLLEECDVHIDFHPFDSEDEIEALASLLSANSSGHFGRPSTLTGAVVFLNNPTPEANLMYKIRLVTSKFITRQTFPDVDLPGPGEQYQMYEETGFLGLQLAIDESFLFILSGKPPNFEITTQALPYPPYNRQERSHFTVLLSVLLPASLVFGFTSLISSTAKALVKERNTGLKQYLHIVGYSVGDYWFGWFLDVFLLAAVSATVILICLTIDVFGVGAAVEFSSKSIMWTLLMLYLFSSCWFTFFLASSLSSENYSRAFAATVWIGTLLVPAALVGTQHHFFGTQLVIAILPNMCLYWGFGVISAWESKGTGAQWENLHDYPSTEGSLNLAMLFAMLGFNGLFYCVLTMIRPNRHFKQKLKTQLSLLQDLANNDNASKLIRFFKCGCLRKRHHNACNDVSEASVDSSVGKLRTKIFQELNLYGTRLTSRTSPALIGHPLEQRCTSGIVLLKSPSKNKEMLQLLGDSECNSVTESSMHIGGSEDEGSASDVVGWCPSQCERLIIGDLTVVEHLVFYGLSKGRGLTTALVDAKQITASLQMQDISNVQGKRLNTSEKRLLCCGIAFTGNSNVLAFDDPLVGLNNKDSKRFWNAVKIHKNGRRIILTSSSISSAASIANKISVISDEKPEWKGSQEYLPHSSNEVKGYTIQLRVSGSGERLVRIICLELGRVQVVGRILTVDGEEVSLLFPYNYAPLFPKLFYQLFKYKKELRLVRAKIDGIMVDNNFARVRELKEFADDISPLRKAEHDIGLFKHPDDKRLNGARLRLSQTKALLLKNVRLSLKKPTTLLFRGFIPLCLILIGVFGANRGLRNREIHRYDDVNIGLKGYNNPVVVLGIHHEGFRLASTEILPNPSRTLLQNQNSLESELDGIARKDLAKFRQRFVAGIIEDGFLNITAMYSSIPFHSPPLAVNLVTNALLKMMYPGVQQNIIVENHPLKNVSTATEPLRSILEDSGQLTVLRSVCILFALAIAVLCGSIVLGPLVERITGSHHMQLMTGVSPIIYWGSFLILDGLWLLVFAAASIGVIFLAQERFLFTMYNAYAALLSIFVVGGFASISFSYCFSRLINDKVVALVSFSMLHFLSVMGSYLVFHAHDGVNDALLEIFFWVTTPFPIPFMVHALYIYGRIALENSKCELLAKRFFSRACLQHELFKDLQEHSCCGSCDGKLCFKPQNYFSTAFGHPSYALSLSLTVLGTVGLVYLTAIILLDYGIAKKMQTWMTSLPANAFNGRGDKDPSASKEAEDIRKILLEKNQNHEQFGLLVNDLCKNYGKIALYTHISFAVSRDQCFGLLGLQGSGKSAVFKTLSGQMLPATGDAVIPPSYSMLANKRKFCARIGYCPQANHNFVGLTAPEALQLYGKLKGIPTKRLCSEIKYWMQELGLENDNHCLLETFSPEMQRRFCLAVAFLGCNGSTLIMLDDPTRDIKPAMKQQIWKTIQHVRHQGKAVLIASRNIVECEHLCEKIGLIINGRLQYVGSTEEIQSKFLNGFTVTFKLTKQYERMEADDNLESMKDVMSRIEGILDDAIFRSSDNHVLKYLIPQKGQDWGEVIEKLEKVRVHLADKVAAYSMTESTLEEVFHAMTELELESTNELPGANANPLQKCCMGDCIEDYC